MRKEVKPKEDIPIHCSPVFAGGASKKRKGRIGGGGCAGDS